MSTTKSKPTKRLPVKDHQPFPSKYTYADLSNFHRTIIAILGKDKPNTLKVSDLATVLEFICIITDLIDSPQIFNYSIKENLQTCNLSSSTYPLPKIKGIGVIGSSKKCLIALIIWMRRVITIPDLSLEKLLDDYYTTFPYALKPAMIPKAHPVQPHPHKNKNKSSGKL